MKKPTPKGLLKTSVIHKQLMQKPGWATGWLGQSDTLCGQLVNDRKITNRWSKVTCKNCLRMRKAKP